MNLPSPSSSNSQPFCWISRSNHQNPPNPPPSLPQQQPSTLSPPYHLPQMLPSLHHHHHHHHLLLLLLLLLLNIIPLSHQQNSTCPLDFSILNKFISSAASNPSTLPSDTPTRCLFALQALHLVQSQYLLTSSLFLPPPSSSLPCWASFQDLISPLIPSFNVLSSCGFLPQWISQGCMNITTLSQFESIVPPSARDDMRRNCGGSLLANAACTPCTTSLNRVANVYLPGPQVGNVSDCASYTAIYAGAELNSLGPADDGTALCLFLLNSTVPTSPSSHSSTPAWAFGVGAACFLVLLLVLIMIWFLLRRRRRRRRLEMKKQQRGRPENSAALQSISASTTLVKFKFEDIKAATKNFSRQNIIGRGGYGNVYRGVLDDGSEVALKRFKNCSAAGDASFAHEVEVIASVRHVNLLALRGYCTATTPLEGHQRIIVCDLMKNGSLHDHLFSSLETKLSWPIRQRIAIGTARGLSYLHYGAQPSIIHRDIKASNILLDDRFEAMVADFGLAKFAPEGMSHMSTKVAGTLGYVAPEYALYGQLTEKSDVYSFGVLLLELLSGRKAFVSKGPGETFLVTDWAWSLVRKGRTLDVIEDGMAEMGPEEVMEKYVLTAVLASHPQMHARPTMDQIVNILETNVEVPMIPDRPIPVVANMDDIERSVSSSGSCQLSSFAGYRPFLHGSDGSRSDDSDVV